MKVTINRCDLCGADATSENPVTMSIGGVPTGRRVTSVSLFGRVSEKEERESLDLCEACGAGIVDIVRAAVARRRSLVMPQAAKPAPSTDGGLALLAAMPEWWVGPDHTEEDEA